MVYSSSGRCIRGKVRVATLDNCLCYVIENRWENHDLVLFVYKKETKTGSRVVGANKEQSDDQKL